MASRKTTPTTPFIPPFGSPSSSNGGTLGSGGGEPAPVIPNGYPGMGGYSPAWNQPQTIGGYPVMSPYINGPPPFIPNFSPAATNTPNNLPHPISRNSSRGASASGTPGQGGQGGLSHDYTGYPQATPATSPTHLGMYGPTSGPAPTPVIPHQAHTPYGGPQNSPWFPPSGVAAWGGTPYGHGQPQLPPGTPWAHPGAGLGIGMGGGGGGPPPLVSAGGHGPPLGHYNPFNMPPMATPAWGAGMFTAPMTGAPLPPMGGGGGGGGGGRGMHPPAGGGMAADPWASLYGGPAAVPPPARPAPPLHAHDRVDQFLAGKHYGPVLDPFLIRVVGAQVKINPLISSLSDDAADPGPHLRWNMLYPASTIQRTDDPPYMSWSKGRNTPATFPRVTNLRLVFASSPNEASSAIPPWLVDVRAHDREAGVTCGEVMDSLAISLSRFTMREDYESLPQKEKREVGMAYKHNRSIAPDVPGGALGEGMKRLDFLKTSTQFNGVENDEKTVKRLLGTVMPCVFVVRTMTRLPKTRQELREQEMRSRSASVNAARSRSRANSTNTRVTVQAPSTTSDDSSEEGADR